MNHETAKPAVPGTGQDELPLEVRHRDMSSAFDAGTAVTLSETITDFVYYRGAWWIVDLTGWLRITDDLTTQQLERHARWANPEW